MILPYKNKCRVYLRKLSLNSIRNSGFKKELIIKYLLFSYFPLHWGNEKSFNELKDLKVLENVLVNKIGYSDFGKEN